MIWLQNLSEDSSHELETSVDESESLLPQGAEEGDGCMFVDKTVPPIPTEMSANEVSQI